MAAIGQIDTAGTANIRGLAQNSAVAGLSNEDQDEFNRGADIDRANERQAAAARPAAGGEQASAGNQVNDASNVSQANAVATNGDGTDEQAEVRSEVASQDQQLPTPFDPSRGTQLDIAV
jgi:hypothetical protein